MRILILLLFSVACFDSGNSPESVLKDFVEVRLEKIANREDVIRKATGKMRLSLEAMDDKDFNLFADLRQYKKNSFRIISKSCQEKKCYITYALSYRQAPAGKTLWSSEVKKIVEVHWVDGKWLIADVSNIKTYHEAAESIEITP